MPEITPSDFLAAGFPTVSEDPDFSSWFAHFAPARKPSTSKPLSNPKVTQFKTIARSRPSDAGHGMLSGAAFFSEFGGLSLGSEVHRLLSAIEWLPPDTLPVSHSPIAQDLVETFLQHSETRKIFERPAIDSIVWRERSVACRLNNITISAQMDRVVIQPPKDSNSKGKILLVDFKTDKGNPNDIAKRYTAQMQAYVKILEAWSQGNYEITAAIATIRMPAIIII